MEQSFKNMAQRRVNAENTFIECVMASVPEITKDDAAAILGFYIDHKMVKYDAIGRYTVKHGGLWEARVLRDVLKLSTT